MDRSDLIDGGVVAVGRAGEMRRGSAAKSSSSLSAHMSSSPSSSSSILLLLPLALLYMLVDMTLVPPSWILPSVAVTSALLRGMVGVGGNVAAHERKFCAISGSAVFRSSRDGICSKW